MHKRQTLIGISDVSTGYGSPEVRAMMGSLSCRLGVKAILIEPDEHDRRYVPVRDGENFDLDRVQTDLKPQSLSWRRYYLHCVAKKSEPRKTRNIDRFRRGYFWDYRAIRL